ncbi:MAG: hypothetical protein GY859_30410, partial [Desulfobacterales bacterium]|nr:hypothetical protein [Desulfobacterales bacterium]
MIGKNKTVLFNQENQHVGTQYNIKGNLHQGPAPGNDDEEALRIYREFLARSCANVSMRGIDREISDAGSRENPLGLANVYIDLNTTAAKEKAGEEGGGLKGPGAGREERETIPLSALEAAAGNERMALVGDPGGGKTTFVRHLAHCLADPDKRDNPAQWPGNASEKLPILVILRDFAHSLPDPAAGKAEPKHLWTFIAERMARDALDDAVEPVRRVLEKGEAIVLLDGLDEVST